MRRNLKPDTKMNTTTTMKLFYAITKSGDVYGFETKAARTEFCATHGHPRYDATMGASWVGSGDYADPIPASHPAVRAVRKNDCLIEKAAGVYQLL